MSTPAQKRWWNRFAKTMREMPASMEILIGSHGQISAAERGASSRYFAHHGDVDNVPRLTLPEIRPKGVENNGSSL